MKNNPLDDIVKCTVDISSPASNDVSFDSILLVVSAPTGTGTKTITKTTAIASADELKDYGYTTSSAAYKAASVAFAQSPSPDQIYVCVRQTVTTGSGNDAVTTNEGIADTLARANAEAPFYGIHLTEFGTVSADVAAAATWAESNEKLFGFEYANIASCPISNFTYFRTFGVFSGLADGYAVDAQPAENAYAALALMAKCFGYDPGTETWHLKELATIVPSALSTDQKATLKSTNINMFLRYAGSNVTIGGYVLAGEWIDVIRFRDWLKATMQIRCFSVLKQNRKVPFTDAGIALIQGAMEAVLANGQRIGGIADTEFDSDGNRTPGYVTHVPLSSDLSDIERKSRKLTGCWYTARLAGAIHAVEIQGYLTF